MEWQQINLITKKVNKGLNILRRLREFVDLNILIIIYKTLVQPHFDYCYFSSRAGGEMARLSRQMGLGTRNVDLSVDLLNYLNISDHETRRNQQLSTLMFKVNQ